MDSASVEVRLRSQKTTGNPAQSRDEVFRLQKSEEKQDVVASKVWCSSTKSSIDVDAMQSDDRKAENEL